MRVECNAKFPLVSQTNGLESNPVEEKKRLQQWLIELPEDAVIRTDNMERYTITAHWDEER